MLSHDDAVNVGDGVSFVLEQLATAAEEYLAVNVFVLGVFVREVLADVAEGGGSEKGVADGVEENVGIAMAEESEMVGYLYASQPKRAVGGELVNVVAYSDAHSWGVLGVRS